jgi:hypothetical protein
VRFEPTEYRDHSAWLSLDPQVLLGAPHGNLRRRPGIPWSRFGLFPFLLILVVLLGALGVPDLFDKAVDEAQTRSSQYVPRQLEPVAESAREQAQPLLAMSERAEERAGGKLPFFAIALALWSVSALARTLTEARLRSAVRCSVRRAARDDQTQRTITKSIRRQEEREGMKGQTRQLTAVSLLTGYVQRKPVVATASHGRALPGYRIRARASGARFGRGTHN